MCLDRQEGQTDRQTHSRGYLSVNIDMGGGVERGAGDKRQDKTKFGNLSFKRLKKSESASLKG